MKRNLDQQRSVVRVHQGHPWVELGPLGPRPSSRPWLKDNRWLYYCSWLTPTSNMLVSGECIVLQSTCLGGLFLGGGVSSIFLRIGPKTQNFVPSNINNSTIEHYKLSTLYHFWAEFSTRKLYFKPKLQKNVLANVLSPQGTCSTSMATQVKSLTTLCNDGEL